MEGFVMAVTIGEIERECEYRPNWTMLLAGSGFFSACGALCVHLALTNQEQVVIQGIVRLSPFGGRILYCILALTSAIFVAGTLFLAYIRMKSVQRIAITRNGIILPTGKWNRRDETLVPFDAIVAVKILAAKGTAFLYIYAGGLRYTVYKSFLAKGSFDEIMLAIESRVQVPVERLVA
jgi:hypothetical protein